MPPLRQQRLRRWRRIEIQRIDSKTIVFDKVVKNLNKRCHESGIITSDPKYWAMTPYKRRQRIDEEFYISLMKFA